MQSPTLSEASGHGNRHAGSYPQSDVRLAVPGKVAESGRWQGATNPNRYLRSPTDGRNKGEGGNGLARRIS